MRLFLYPLVMFFSCSGVFGSFLMEKSKLKCLSLLAGLFQVFLINFEHWYFYQYLTHVTFSYFFNFLIVLLFIQAVTLGIEVLKKDLKNR